MQVALCIHPELPAARAQRESCMAWLAKQGVESIAVDTNQLRIDSDELAELLDETKEVSLVCALGGDGTILRATRLAYAAQVPLLGVNFGHLGFLSGATSAALYPALQAFLQNQLEEDRRVMLQAEAHLGNDSVVSYFALNELVLGRHDMGRVIDVDVNINGRTLPSPRGDGVIVATATGSTGYAHSAGGPLLTPDNQGLCLVPLSAMGFNAAALVTAPSDVICLSPRPRSEQHALLCIDGQTLDTNGKERQLQAVYVHKAEQDMILLRYDAPDFYTRIAHSLAGEGHAH